MIKNNINLYNFILNYTKSFDNSYYNYILICKSSSKIIFLSYKYLLKLIFFLYNNLTSFINLPIFLLSISDIILISKNSDFSNF